MSALAAACRRLTELAAVAADPDESDTDDERTSPPAVTPPRLAGGG